MRLAIRSHDFESWIYITHVTKETLRDFLFVLTLKLLSCQRVKLMQRFLKLSRKLFK